MTTQNKDILNQVKGEIKKKKNNFDKINKNSSKFLKNDLIQDEINKWIEKMLRLYLEKLLMII